MNFEGFFLSFGFLFFEIIHHNPRPFEMLLLISFGSKVYRKEPLNFPKLQISVEEMRRRISLGECKFELKKKKKRTKDEKREQLRKS